MRAWTAPARTGGGLRALLWAAAVWGRRRGVLRLRAACKRAGAPAAAALAGAPVALGFVAMLVVVVAASALFAAPGPGALGGGEAALAAAGRSAAASAAAPRLLPVRPTEVRRGVSLVAACHNRHDTLRKTLPTWLRLRHVSELVIVDWASDPPLHDLVREITTNPRVRVIRVDDEPDWVLSRAYNLAVSAASREDIIRADCDYQIDPDFVRVHDLHAPTPKADAVDPAAAAVAVAADPAAPAPAAARYYAGNYHLARNENEVHLNGAVFTRRSDFMRVAGYDERIQTYGWDDTDLYNRLGAAAVARYNISYDHIHHVVHGDSARVQRNVQFAQVEIDLNALLLEHLPMWSPAVAQGIDPASAATQWIVTSTTGSSYVAVKASRRPSSLRDLVTPAVLEKEWGLALGRRLHDDYELPWDIIGSMDAVNRRKVLKGLVEAAARPRRETGPPRVLLAHVMHGLGNRLRALASAMSFAKQSGRVLVLVWETDAHISAKFGDLFKNDLPMITRFNPKWPFTGNEQWDKSWTKLHAVNYVEMDGHGALKDAFIVDRSDKHMYFKSSCIMNTRNDYSNWDMDNAELRSLEPVDEVTLTVKDHIDRSGLAERIGMHIRDRTLERDIKNVNFTTEYGSTASSTMDFWRRKSSHRTFEREMRILLKDDPSAKFYVASDTREVVESLARAFPDKVLWTPRDCDGRDSHCVKYALIDVLALSKTRALYGSNWSSFTEAAQRLGGPKALLAGQDFGRKSEEGEPRVQ